MMAHKSEMLSYCSNRLRVNVNSIIEFPDLKG